MQKAPVQGDGMFAAPRDTRAGQRVGMMSATAPVGGLQTNPAPHFPRCDSAVPRQRPLLSAAPNAVTTSQGLDEVTSVLTRSQFRSILRKSISAGKRADEHLTLLFLGLDNFRRINSCYGHAAGDKILHTVAQRLWWHIVSRNGVICRFAGDQFAVLIQGDADVAYGASILEAVAAPYDLYGASITLSASVGIARYPFDSRDADEILQFADTAMYTAKESGGHAVRWFAPEMKASAVDLMMIEGRLRQALEGGEFSLHYQPIQRAGSGDTQVVETLLRWKTPQEETIAPDRFIPVAEKCGLIHDIGRWVLREACRQRGEWYRTRRSPITVTVNASPLQLADPGFCDGVKLALEAAKLPPNHLVIEITERLIVDDDLVTIAKFHRLNVMGIRVALDDFGTGYSSLGYLTRFQIHSIKIDKSFIRNIVSDAKARALVQAIIGIGKSLNISMVAEGVETAEQAALLERYGCNFLQGYLISRPMAPEFI